MPLDAMNGTGVGPHGGDMRASDETMSFIGDGSCRGRSSYGQYYNMTFKVNKPQLCLVHPN